MSRPDGSQLKESKLAKTQNEEVPNVFNVPPPELLVLILKAYKDGTWWEICEVVSKFCASPAKGLCHEDLWQAVYRVLPTSDATPMDNDDDNDRIWQKRVTRFCSARASADMETLLDIAVATQDARDVAYLQARFSRIVYKDRSGGASSLQWYRMYAMSLAYTFVRQANTSNMHNINQLNIIVDCWSLTGDDQAEAFESELLVSTINLAENGSFHEPVIEWLLTRGRAQVTDRLLKMAQNSTRYYSGDTERLQRAEYIVEILTVAQNRE